MIKSDSLTPIPRAATVFLALSAAGLSFVALTVSDEILYQALKRTPDLRQDAGTFLRLVLAVGTVLRGYLSGAFAILHITLGLASEVRPNKSVMFLVLQIVLSHLALAYAIALVAASLSGHILA